MTEELDRRDWMRLVAVLSVAAPTVAQAPAPASQQGQRPNVPQRVSKADSLLQPALCCWWRISLSPLR